ncbi:MAG: RNA-binding protein [Candidatus Bathyarchaeota archaeon]|nr:RNA-binding protein [Candidatus Bathyarchaeota archaeon]
MKDKEAKRLVLEFQKKMRINLQRMPALQAPIELAKVNSVEIFLISKKPLFARIENDLYPTLVTKDLLLDMPKAIVNMGAVPYVCNGADVMAPGLIGFKGDFKKGDMVIVLDERHQKPIAVTLALCNAEEAGKLQHGRVLKNVHYVGDKVWKAIMQLSK